MLDHLTNATDVRLLLSETLWLEPEHYQQAKQISEERAVVLADESQHWQAYLNALAMLAFESWLAERLPNHTIQTMSNQVGAVSYIMVDQFKLCLIAVEHVLDETVLIPRAAIEQPDLAAHFYVALEVLEDQEEVVVRGALRRDELVALNNYSESLQTDEVCPIPLAAFDAELNHLVVCLHYSEPSKIPLPMAIAQPIKVSPTQNLSTVGVRLSQWLQGALDQGWRAIDELVNPEMSLAWGARHSPSSGVRGGKLINFGVQLGNQTVVLLVTVISESDGRIGVNAQVLPTGDQRVLPSQLKLALLSSTDKMLQEVHSRDHDNYIQLKPFKGRPGINFSIEVSLRDTTVKETFEL